VVIYGIDISSFQSDMRYLQTDIYRRAHFVIAQAYAHISPGGTARQLRAARDDGKLKTAYTFLWHGPSYRTADKTVQGDMRSRLSAIPDDVPLDGRLWLDLEDNVSPDWGTSGHQVRRDEVLQALDVMDEWAAAHGLPESGIYTSGYYIDLLYGGWYPQNVPLWLAHYGLQAGSPLGQRRYNTTVVGHQYTSEVLDQNLFLDSEFAPQEAEVPIPQEYQEKFNIGPHDIQGLIDHLEGVGNQKYEQGVQAGLDQANDALEKLAKVKEIVGAS
jgi:GH25 family lysozyme M1 (1,4-beta-N-acetylmuramidase)